ncbi:MAG: hypothetical protein KDA83_15285 [Planctomycetales bacterium]|nr:hypothetical protein [Planctomycetales bacterium]
MKLLIILLAAAVGLGCFLFGVGFLMFLWAHLTIVSPELSDEAATRTIFGRAIEPMNLLANLLGICIVIAGAWIMADAFKMLVPRRSRRRPID